MRIEAAGETARMMQHETDHLDGILMLDRARPEERKRGMRQWREHLLSRGRPLHRGPYDTTPAYAPDAVVARHAVRSEGG